MLEQVAKLLLNAVCFLWDFFLLDLIALFELDEWTIL